MSYTTAAEIKVIDVASFNEDQIEEFITAISVQKIDNDMADALLVFAQKLVTACGKPFDSKCIKAIYLQKVILLKIDPDNYNKNITITDDVNNIDIATPDPTVEKDADDGTTVTPVTPVDTSGKGAGAPGAPSDGTPGAPGSTAGTGTPGAPGDGTGTGDGKGTDGTGAGAPSVPVVTSTDGAPVDTSGKGAPVPNNSTVPIANNTTGPSANNSTGPPPASDAADPNKVILSYEGDGKYSVKDKFEPDSNYHVLERKDKNQCFAYNPSYNPSETVPTSAEQTTLSDKAVNVGNRLNGTAQGIKTSLGNAAQGVGNTLNNFFGRNKYEKMDETENLLNTTGGKRKTKKRRTTRKLNQRKRLGFKSRSNK